MKANPIIIISLDGVGRKDFDLLKTLPNFGKLLKSSSYSYKVNSIYPSLTYPAHTSIVTGKKPVNHGVINNILLQHYRASSDWFWFRSQVDGETIYDLAKKEGYTTGAILWPVTGKAKIDYNIPEIFANRWWHTQAMVSLCSGSPIYQLLMNFKYGYLREGKKQPELDNFSTECALYLLKKERVDFLMLHLTDVDTMKHHNGTENEEVTHALRRHDARLGKILEVVNNNECYKNSTIILLGDHSLIDTEKIIKLNTVFLKEGYITKDEKGTFLEPKVYMNNCDGSAYVYIKDSTEELQNKIIDLIKDFSKNNDDCIEEIISGDDLKPLGVDKNCTLMLEAKKGYYFSNDLDGDAIEDVGEKYDKATHGYSPFKEDYQTFFLVSGDTIRKDYNIGQMNLIDEAPTIAKIIGKELEGVDGRVISSIFDV
ncbi:ectonucleotide pyrophosphatase/phosphodiesterase [Clostridium sp. C8-1-8]|uniref:alkaline phosphatase family protein n=1 Tax=Clostridium sp. C8-1-8 TaxID=2698831 RepID=UPI00136BB165|nr:ectonucleotide pyrophosphatase/phosphodiesterase [Clostridium sp. C8-1-8]